MKINQESINLIASKTTQSEADRHAFEQLLFTPAKQQAEGQFYRQHQHTLQPSCLTFHALQKHKKTDAFALQSNEFTKESTPLPAENTLQIALMQAQKTTTKAEEFTNEMLANKQSCAQSGMIKQHFSVYAEPAKNLLLKENSAEKTPTPRTVKPQTEYKNHHLFIDANDAELAINTAQLAPQELKKLLPVIRQALRDKKIQLQQLIINGERQ